MSDLIEATTKNAGTMSQIKFNQKLFEMLGKFDSADSEVEKQNYTQKFTINPVEAA